MLSFVSFFFFNSELLAPPPQSYTQPLFFLNTLLRGVSRSYPMTSPALSFLAVTPLGTDTTCLYEISTTQSRGLATYLQASPPPDKPHCVLKTPPLLRDTTDITAPCQPPQDSCLHRVLPLPAMACHDVIGTNTTSSYPSLYDLAKAQSTASVPKWFCDLWLHPYAEACYFSCYTQLCVC